MALIEYYILTGQSYTTGSSGGPALTTTPTYPSNAFQVLNSADAAAEAIDYGTLTTLQEGDNWDTGNNTNVERPSSALGYGIYEYRRDIDGVPGAIVALTTYGIGGRKLSVVASGIFDEHMARLDAAVAENTADTVRVYLIHIMQGERDQREVTAPATYLSQLASFYTDANTRIKAATGQTEDLIGFVQDQMDGWTEYDFPWPRIGLAQLSAHRNYTYHTLTGPRYHLERSGDGLHLQNDSYRHLGEMHARVGNIVRAGGRWEPVHPWSIERDGVFVTIRFHVPVGPLVLDTTTVPFTTDYGFNYHDTADPSDTSEPSAHVVGVSVVGSDTVVLELDAVPTGTPGYISAGWLDRHVNLRDSDTTVSQYDAVALQNWCCHFYDPIGYAGDPPDGGDPGVPDDPFSVVVASYDASVGLGWNGAEAATDGPADPTGVTATSQDAAVLLTWHEVVAFIAVTGSPSLPALESTGQATAAIDLSGEGTLPDLTATGAANVETSAEGAATLPALESTGEAAVGSVPITLEGEAILPALEATGASTVDLSASGAATLPALTSSGQASILVVVIGAGTLPGLTSAGSVGSFDPVSIEGTATLPVLTAAGTVFVGELVVPGPLDIVYITQSITLRVPITSSITQRVAVESTITQGVSITQEV